MYKEIPCWNEGEWTTVSFEFRDEFKEFVLSLFKEPGQYEFDESSLFFNEQARLFRAQGFYCDHPMKSKDYINYWDDQKNKCRQGVIFKNGSKTWYLPRDYYMWINFLQINDKEQKKFDFVQVRDAQYHMALYEMLAELHYMHAAIVKKRQIASEQPHSEPVLTEHGWSTMGELKVGDKLWNPDGTLTTILHKSDNGLSNVYEFEFIDGRKTRCGIEHNWQVFDKAAQKNKVLNTKQLLDTGILKTPVQGKNKQYNNYRYYISLVSPVPFPKQSLSVDPYVLGVLLGDGHVNSRSITIAGKDEQIFNIVSEILAQDYELKTIGYCKKGISYKKRFSQDCDKYHNGKYGCNPLLRELLLLGLGKPGKNTKFIPEVYLKSSIDDRIALLQGLLDTDGFVSITGNNIHFTNTNKRLIDQVAELSRSLGLKVIIKSKQGFYRLLFSGNIPFDIFRLDRKLTRQGVRKNKKTFDLIPIVAIKQLSYQEQSSCIVVDNPNHLYITRDYIVTHNSYFHCAKLINQLWFEETPVLKMGASLKDYVNEKGSWKFLTEYKSFLDQHTAWYRPMNPGKVFMWQQQIEETVNNRKYLKGLKGVIQGVTFDKDPTNGVGGPCSYFFYEEAGIAPTMDTTVEYLFPAMRSGQMTTGLFIAAGSVGDLDQCEPLKQMIFYPEANSIYGVKTNLLDDKGNVGTNGLFIPEHWSMPPYIDQYGNSMIKEALESIMEERKLWKKDLSPEKYQLRISQHPINIAEAFAFRNISKFPQNLVSNQIHRIEDKHYPYEFVELVKNAEGHIEAKETSKLPIREFPIGRATEDKTGAVVVWERPVKDAEFGTYYASVDPVSEGKTTTSDSLCSIYVYKNPVEVTRINGDTSENHVERDMIVAAWCGRFDDINKTHERLELLIEWYNAWTIVENNVSLFIRHMIDKKKQKYLVPKNQIIFLKDLGSNNNVFQEYGWRNTGNLFSSHLLSYLIEFLKEEINITTDHDGTIVKITHGIERIPDIMAMKEMQAYNDDVNVDRLVALAALVAFAKVQQANRGYRKRVERLTNNLHKPENLYKLNISPFKHMGNKSVPSSYRTIRKPFKNFK